MPPRFLVFGNLRFDMSTRELVRVEASGATTPLPLGSRAADMLALFLQRPGDLVAKNEIMNAVWPNTTIEDSNLTVQISALRRALDAGRDGASAIATVPGRGYRFNLPVQEEAAPETPLAPAPARASGDAAVGASGATAAAADAPAGRRAGVPTWVALVGGALLVVLVAFVLHRGGFLSGPAEPPAARDAALNRIYDRGLASMRNGRLDDAIADFSEVIRQDPWKAEAYLQRGRVRRYKGDYDGTIADGGKLVELMPGSYLGYLERAHAYLAIGELDRAIADYDVALRLAPDVAESLLGRGRAYFFKGDMAKAQADLQSCAKVWPKGFLPVLWLGVVEQRGKLPGGLEAAERRFNMAMWAGPVLRMLAGEFTSAQALAAVNDKDPAEKQRQVCQVNFYAGEIALARGTRDEAARLFRLAADGCPRTYIEAPDAAFELRALGVSR